VTTLETLKAARAKIVNEDDWYQAPIDCPSSGYKRVDGRLRRCSGAAIADSGAPWPGGERVFKALEEFMQPDVPTFNDNHTHAEVLAAFDAAIAKIETPEGDK
jgi:hypothetical protein